MVKSEAELASRSLDIPYVEVSAIDGTGIEQVSLYSHACGGDDKIINRLLNLFLLWQAFTSLVRKLMKKAAKDKRYGQTVREDDNSSHDHHGHSEHASGGHWDNMAAQTYPPNAVIMRNQPTSHTPNNGRNVTSNSIPQPTKLCFCC